MCAECFFLFVSNGIHAGLFVCLLFCGCAGWQLWNNDFFGRDSSLGHAQINLDLIPRDKVVQQRLVLQNIAHGGMCVCVCVCVIAVFNFSYTCTHHLFLKEHPFISAPSIHIHIVLRKHSHDCVV